MEQAEDIKQIKDFKILSLLDKFKSFFEKTGVDYAIMRRLLQLMLIMDGRKTSTIMGGQSKNIKRDGDSNPFSGYLVSCGILGFFIMIMMFLPYSIFYKMTLCFGMIIFMLMTTMISDFSSILLDVKDKIILVPKPIGSKTINAAKTLHIAIYLLIICAAIAGPSLLVGTFKYGLVFTLIFIIQLLFMVVFVIFLTSILYFLILQFFDGEKVKDIINFFQIFLSITMTIGYQFIGRAFDLFKSNVAFTPKWWGYALPPVWFGAPYSYFLENKKESVYLVLSIMGIMIPVILFLLYYFKISPYFEKNLYKLSAISTKKSSSLEKRILFSRKLSSIICPDKLENTFYHFTADMISNERQLKLKLYPSLAYAAIFPFIFLINMFTGSKSFENGLSEIAASPMYLNIYLSIMLFSSLYSTIYASEKYKCSWIYKTLPLENPSAVYKGSLKCFLAKYILPIFLFLGFIFFLLFGIKLIPHLVVMFITLIILVLINFKITPKALPFSIDLWVQNKDQQNGSGCFILIVNALCCGFGAAVEYLVSKLAFGIYIYAAVLLIAMVILWKSFLNVSWSDINKSSI